EGIVTGCARARDLEPLDESYADGLSAAWYWDGEFPLEEVAFEPAVAEEPGPAEEKPAEVCECYAETGERLCLEDCACPCHEALIEETLLESEAPLEAPEAPEPPAPVIEIYAEPNPVIIGEEVTLYAVPENIASAIWQWQYSRDDANWINIEGANALSYTFKSDEDSIRLYYRMLALDPVPETPESPEQLPPEEPPAAPEESGGGDILARLGALLFPSALAEPGNFIASGSLMLTSAGEPVAANANTGELYLTLQDAVDEAEDGDTLEVLADIALDSTVSIDKPLQLVADGSFCLSRGGFDSGPLLEALGGGALTLGGSGSLTLDGDDRGGCVVGNWNNTLILRDGAKITGGSADGAYTGGVYNFGTFIMLGGTISGNGGGGVTNGIDKMFTMSGGTISGNSAEYGGGVYNLGAFTMTDGTISGNSAEYGGGVRSDIAFTMTGGRISGNSADYGGGVYIQSASLFSMEAGTISGNSADYGGGAYTGGPFAMSGGTIFGNSAVNSGGGVYATGMFAMGGDAVIVDEVYLHDTAITVASSFTGSARVRPDSYDPPYRQILAPLVGDTYSEAMRARFPVSPNETGSWVIDEDGKLAPMVVVALVSGGGGPEMTCTAFGLAVNAANDRSGATIMLLADVQLDFPAHIISDVTLMSVGAHRITRGPGCAGDAMFVVLGTGTLRLVGGGGLVIDGRGVAGENNSIVFASPGGSTLTMDSGVTLTGAGGSAVKNYGTFTMNGGTISGNRGNFGSGVSNGVSFTMNGGVISGNSALCNGGGVFNDGTFTLNNGTISGNSAVDFGGGVYNANAASTMHGGLISGNSAHSGGGVYNYHAFAMDGGSISGNEAQVWGDGVFNYGTFEMSGGALVEDEFFLDAATITVVDAASFTGGAPVRPGQPGSYEDGRQVLTALPVGETYDTATRLAFPILSDGEGFWLIDDLGQLERKCDVVAKVSASGEPDAFFVTFDEAMDAANALGTATITMLADVELEEGAMVESGNDITLTADDWYTIARGATHLGSMLGASGTLRLTGKLTIDGNDVDGPYNHIAEVLTGGMLTMSSGVTLTGGRTETAGGGVLSWGTFRMFGGTITNNIAASAIGGGVYNAGTFWMTGGTITGNAATAAFGSGGGVYNAGTFRMLGGTIANNAATSAFGGGVFNNATFRMTGGEISGNTADYGGGVAGGGGTCTLFGGKISGNTADSYGGGVYSTGPSSLTVNGGSFVNNTSTLDGAGGGIFATNSVTMNTTDLFEDSTLYFGAIPTILTDTPIRLSMDATDAAGRFAVYTTSPGWLSEDDFALVDMEAFTLCKVGVGTHDALQLWLVTETEVTISDATYGDPLFNFTATVTAGIDLGIPYLTIVYATAEEGIYGIDPVDVGDYLIKAEYGGNAVAHCLPSMGTAAFSILPAKPTIALKDKKADYTGSPIPIGKATVTGVFGEALPLEITYKYYGNAALTERLAGPPTDGGTYYATASVEAAGNYAAASKKAKLTIVGGEEEEEVPITQVVVINGVEIELVVGPTEDLTINGETCEGALVDAAGTPRAFTAHIEAIEAPNEETGQPEIVQAILFIAAEPDLDENGEPVLGENGLPRYSQRNLQLEPEWIRELAALGITDICYTLGDASLMLPLAAFEDPALAEGTRFSVRVAPIYGGETRPAEDSALAGYSVESGLYRVYIVMETADGEVDIAALLAGAALRLPAEEEIAPEEQERFGMLFVPV
ncbi:MAG: hypothetical protein GX592_02180, partial [Clostridiales bacterium]|nr:hypothetical protein [Clostridiales bacterium]